MVHLPGLIADLALILITGAITTILFRKIRQPLVLGYIIAGFVVGPHLSFTPTVTDTENIETWAEIGVIFLLFSLGLEFSFRKLSRLGGAASITAIVEVIFITLAGYLLGTAMGWSLMDSVFLGGMLASSSTTIISKAFDELAVKTQKFAGVVIGVLIVEDLFVIMLMVLLSTVAVAREIEGMNMIITVLKLSVFLVLWFITGIFLVPTFLKRAKRLLNEETLLILSVGLCLVMVVVATRIGFSAELGAFIMGSILAETTSAEKINRLITPVKDLFGAVFFVSVGMMIDPTMILEYRWPILWVTLLVLGGKFISTVAGALISGQSLKQSIQVGMSMAQVGEFAFIVASLGLSLGVTSNFLFPVAVGVSAITTFTTPYMIRFSPAFHDYLAGKLPLGWKERINNYSARSQEIQSESSWQKVIKGYISIVLMNSAIVFAISILAVEFLLPFLNGHIQNPIPTGLIVLLITLATASPFLWAIMAKHPESLREKEVLLDRKYNHGPVMLLGLVRIIIGVLLVGFLLDRLFSPSIALIVGLPIILISIILLSGGSKIFHGKLERLFLGNLNARDDEEDKQGSVDYLHGQFKSHSGLGPWDVHMVDLEVKRNAPFMGKSLKELAWREKYGINIIYIRRGDRLIFAPQRHDSMYVFDHVGIIGTDAQMQSFRPVFEAEVNYENESHNIEDVIIQPIGIHEESRLNGVKLGDSGIREATNGLVIGLEREGKRVLNPESSTVFRSGDMIWIAGERNKIFELIAQDEEAPDAKGSKE